MQSTDHSDVAGIVLMGPPGSGKSYLGRRLAETGRFTYRELEPILVARFGTGAEFAARKEEAIRFIGESLRSQLAERDRPVIFESTGVSDRPLIEKIIRTDSILLVRIDTPKTICLERIANRATGNNLSNDIEAAGRFYDFWHREVEPGWEFDLVVDGVSEGRAIEMITRMVDR